MLNLLGSSVTPESFLMVLIAIFLIAYFVYKEWPEFKKRVSGSAKTEAKSETELQALEERLVKIEKDITEHLAQIEKEQREFREMLGRDYIRLNTAERLARANTKAISDSLEERKIIMQGLVACLIGLQEVGADGPTGEAIKTINEYLNRQAHVNQEITHDAEAPLLNPNI